MQTKIILNIKMHKKFLKKVVIIIIGIKKVDC